MSAKPPFSKQSASPKSNKRSRWNFARRRVSPSCGAKRDGERKRRICLTARPTRPSGFSDASNASVLDTLRAIARSETARTRLGNETNENDEKTPLSSLLPFVSSSESVRAQSGLPPEWLEGYAALCTMPPPSGFSPERWRRVVDAAGTFLDRWGAEAIRCGWSDLDVFGCHDTAPTARFDCMGLMLLLDRCEIVAIDQDGADLVSASSARQRFYRRPLPPGTVSLWELTRR